MLQGSVTLDSPATTPVISPASTPKKETLARKLYQSDVLDGSKVQQELKTSNSSAIMTPPGDSAKRTADELNNDNVVQGPTTNVSFEEMETASAEQGVSSPLSSVERDSPVNSLPDTNGVDLNEVLKVTLLSLLETVLCWFSAPKIATNFCRELVFYRKVLVTADSVVN